MSYLQKRVLTSLLTFATLVSIGMPNFAHAGGGPIRSSVAPWTVTTVTGSDYRTDAPQFIPVGAKFDGRFFAWVSYDVKAKEAGLYVFDGSLSTRVGAIDLKPAGDLFNGIFGGYDKAFDVRDGLVVWTQSDGTDREIYKYDGKSVSKVSDNAYDDELPRTSAGRIAWTSRPSASAYDLVVKDAKGLRKLDSFNVLNYAFSGQNLFWLGKRANDSVFRVFRDDGDRTVAVGEGDDMPNDGYFVTDGKGSAAWTFAPQKWNRGMRAVYLSHLGGNARKMIEREVPPHTINLLDVDGEYVAVSVRAAGNSANPISLIRTNGVTEERLVAAGRAYPDVNFAASGLVREQTPWKGDAIVLHKADGTTEVLARNIIPGGFGADGDVIAIPLKAGGLLVQSRGVSVTIPTAGEVFGVFVADDGIFWVEAKPASSSYFGYVMRYAQRGILVRTAAGTRSVNGTLVKLANSPAVYLAGYDGKRYVIPGEKQFYGWFKDFSSVRTIDAKSLAAMPLGGTVLFRPGTRLVKSASSARVYMIDDAGALRWVRSADLLAETYGGNWRSVLEVLNDAEFSQYALGPEIDSADAYRVALVR